TDAEQLHQLALAHQRSGRELERDDQLANAVVRLVRERACVGRLGLVDSQCGCAHPFSTWERRGRSPPSPRTPPTSARRRPGPCVPSPTPPPPCPCPCAFRR